MPNHQTAQSLYAYILTSSDTDPAVLRKAKEGKAFKATAGDTMRLIGVDVFGNVVFDAGVAFEWGTTQSYYIELCFTDAGGFEAGFTTEVLLQGGAAAILSKVATWICEEVTGSWTLQSGPITTTMDRPTHTHGTIVDYDIKAIATGTEIGVGEL